MKRIICGVFLTTLALVPAVTAADSTPGVYVILDGSGSMWGQLPDGTHKITAAKEVVKGFLADDYAGRELAFRVYGHRREGDCADTELVVPFSAPGQAIGRMAKFADGVNPKGKTPISRSLRAALEDFGDRPGEIILVSDGIETCDEDPCELVKRWRESNVAVRVHVVGLGLEEKEREAMACISEAAGTAYYDAQSADDLAAGLAEIQQTSGEPGEPPAPHWQVLEIKAANEAGERLRVYGTARSGEEEPIEVTSLRRNRVPPGDYEVSVGVRTRNGNVYRPVTQSVTVADSGKSVASFVVPEPPSVTARFLDRGEEIRGSVIRAYQEDREVGTFRPGDRAFFDPGTYDFRSEPNADNKLTVTETLADGDSKELLFELVRTVLARIKMTPAGSETTFRSNYELWQDGELKYRVHRWNGVRALPGVYELRLPMKLTPYVHEGLVLTAEEEQEFHVEVPVGWATFLYQDVDGNPAEIERVFVYRENESGHWVSDSVTTPGERIALVPGEYKAHGWLQRGGTYDDVFFAIAVGDEKEIVLRDKGE